ncbi:hypothetical protein [Thiohalospira sp.]|uniref:hypothetical protein n=1 Tax=Thiohalospira sp. TaxID=3080549 RepID=UPI0039815EC8
MRATQLGLALTLVAPVAGAADFTFTVPVEADRLMKPVARLQVTCSVRDADETVLGRAREEVKVEDRAVEQEVTVEVDADPGLDPTDAATYECTLRLRDASGFRYLRPEIDNDDLPVWARPHPESDPRITVEGELGGKDEGKDGE